MEQDNNMPNESYARSPHRREKKQDSNLRLRNILNIIFMVMALVGVIIYLCNQTFIGTIIILAAMAVKMVECVMRMIK
jgi:hypothetical protein